MGEQKTWITRSMVNAIAFRKLSSSAKDILLQLLLKRNFRQLSGPNNKRKREYICTNCNNLTLTYKELNVKGYHNETIRRAFNSLFIHGFIEHTHRGGAFKKDKSVYKLSDNWKKWKPGMNYDSREKAIRKSRFTGFENLNTTKCEPYTL